MGILRNVAALPTVPELIIGSRALQTIVELGTKSQLQEYAVVIIQHVAVNSRHCFPLVQAGALKLIIPILSEKPSSLYLKYRTCAALSNLSQCPISAQAIEDQKGFQALQTWVSFSNVKVIASQDKSHVYTSLETFLNSSRSSIPVVRRYAAFSAAVLSKKRAHRELIVKQNFVPPLLELYVGNDKLTSELAAEALIEIESQALITCADTLQWHVIFSLALQYVQYNDVDDKQCEEMEKRLPPELWHKITAVGKLLLN